MKLALSLPILALLTVWSAACLWIDGPDSRALAGLLSGGFVVAALGLVVFVRPIGRLWGAFALLFLSVQIWWLGLPASNERAWLPDVARPPIVRFEGDRVTIENVRNFRYRSELDYDERWETRSYDLSKLRGGDLFLSYWGSPMIAHTIISWEFEDGEHLAISIETRKEIGEEYSAVLGFFRQFELYYVVADERDVIGVRAWHRGEDVYLYRLTASPERARAVLLEYLREVNRLADEPRWYNALTHNCTTAIRKHVQHVAPQNPFSWKILVNGHLDELGYERGTIDTSLPFEALRARSYVSDVARQVGPAADFSARIREGLPGARPGPSRRPLPGG